MKIAHVVSAFPDRVTGPRNSVTMLSKYLNLIEGVESRVYTDVADEMFSFNDEVVSPLKTIDVACFDVVVFSNVYNKNSAELARECRRKKVPYVISPRSSLIKSSLYKSWWKKLLFIYGYGFSYLKGSVAIHFLTEEERDFSVLKGQSSFVVGNIVLSGAIGNQEKQKIIGFLGRYDIRHKGLDVLLKGAALAKEDLKRSGWKIVLHGPDFNGGKSKLEMMLKLYGLDGVVTLNGALHGPEKNEFYDRVSVFVHTSRYEGQPQSVMEAMTRRCAILVTPGTNMGRIVKDSFCGEVVDFTPSSIANFLFSLSRDVFNIEDHQDRARAYSLERFSGPVVANDFLGELLKLLGNRTSLEAS